MSGVRRGDLESTKKVGKSRDFAQFNIVLLL
jgi:hypothetical protein